VNGDLDQYLVQPAAGPVTATFTQEVADDWFVLMATFRPAVVDTEAPTAATSLIASGGLGGASLSWTAATDNVGVFTYRVHRGTTPGFTPAGANLAGQTASTTFQDVGLAAGTYYYRVIAADAAGNTGPASNEAAATVTSDTTAPVVSVTAPAPGSTVSGVVSVTASASDNVAVAGVQFMIDGAAFGLEDTVAPYSVEWSAVANGTHTISAIARDASGNSAASALISVTVNNTLPSGLVLALGFNEGTGTTASDASGLGHTGTLSNATWTASGRYGSALSFNGTSSWVTVADAAPLDLTTAMTLSAWVRPTSVTGDYRTVILKERTPSLAYSLYANDGPSRPPAAYVNTGSDRSVIGTSNLPLNTWSHLAVTFGSGVLRLYVNGSLATTTTVSGSIATSTGPFRIGGNAVWGEYFAGLVDEVRVYNRALTQAEIQVDLNSPISGAP
jgi:hypothetical protein